MPQVATHIEEYESLSRDIGGQAVSVVTYRLGGKYVCLVENEDVGAAICRVCGETRDDAMSAGLSEAKKRVRPIPTSTAVLNGGGSTYVDRIVMEVAEHPVAFTVGEFLALSLGERMQLILGGKLAFLDGAGAAIPVGRAIELLRDFENARQAAKEHGTNRKAWR